MSRLEAQVGLGTLPPGTVVDGWRVGEVLGRGAYGTVYRAEPVEAGRPGSFALKLASRPQDRRFEREVGVLSRVSHPRVPRLHGHGWWLHPSGVAFPYLVMEHIEGVGLYEWAEAKEPGSWQVLRVLGDVASALEAVHRAGCVHRDVKGENVLVSREGHGFLIDFGAGDYQGAGTLTEELLPPGTPYYRSPQALRFQWKHRRDKGPHYEPGPADDVYALGVTGYILVTGSAPVCQVSPEWEENPARGSPPPPLEKPSELATVSPELEALLVRMLSDEPQERGNAGELAQAMERATGGARSGWGRAAVMGCVVLAVCMGWNWRRQARVEIRPGAAIALGDTGPLMASASAPQTPTEGLTLDMPKTPLPGQKLSPCYTKGYEVEIELTEGSKETRSCWIKAEANTDKCKPNSYRYQGGCYVPVYSPAPLPQSAKP